MPDRKVRRWLRRRDERGAIILLATVGIVVAMMAAGLAVDAGTLAVEARTNQRVADLAAIDAIRALPVDPTTAAQQSATRNNFPWADTAHGYQFTVEWNDPATGLFGTDPTKLTSATQVRVTVTSPHKNQFAFSTASQSVARKAAAGIGNPAPCPPLPYVCVKSDGTPIGTVRVGSTLAGVTSEATILNKLLTQTVGGSYSLTAVGWQGLAAGNVSFSQLRTALGYSAGTADSVLDASLTYRQLLDATASALHADGSPSSLTAETFLTTLKAQVSAAAGTQLTLRKFLDVVGNIGGGADVADATINVKDIVTGGLTLADTDHFASMNLTATDIPGLPGTGVTVKFGLIEAPQTKSGPPKDGSGTYLTIAHTAQIRLQVLVNLNVSILGLVTVGVTVPYYLEAGRADAKLDTVHCAAGNPVPTAVDILGVTEAGKTEVGQVSDASLSDPTTTPTATTATIASVAGLITATTKGLVTVSIPGNSGVIKTFSPAYTGTTSQSVAGTALTLPNITGGATGDLTVNLAGVLGLSSPALVATTLATAINATLSPLASSLLTPLFKALGLSFASADIWAPPPQGCNPVSFNVGPPGTAPLVPSLIQ